MREGDVAPSKASLTCSVENPAAQYQDHDIVHDRQPTHLAALRPVIDAAEFVREVPLDHRGRRLGLPPLRVAAAPAAPLGPQQPLHPPPPMARRRLAVRGSTGRGWRA